MNIKFFLIFSNFCLIFVFGRLKRNFLAKRFSYHSYNHSPAFMNHLARDLALSLYNDFFEI